MRSALYLEFAPNPSLQITIRDSVISSNIVTDGLEGGAGMTVYKSEVEQDPIIIELQTLYVGIVRTRNVC